MFAAFIIIAAVAVVAVVAVLIRQRRLAHPAAAPAVEAVPGAAPPSPVAAAIPTPIPDLPPPPSIPAELYEPHLGRHHRPVIVPRELTDEEAAAQAAEVVLPHRTLAERLLLPGIVAHALGGYEDPTDLMQALLAITDHPAERDGDLLRLPNAVIIVHPVGVGEPVGREELTGAYGRFLQSGAPCGIFVTPGLLPVDDVRQREHLDPRFVHADFRAIKAMADAAAAGLDPLSGWLPATQSQ